MDKNNLKVSKYYKNITKINYSLVEINSCDKNLAEFENFPFVHLFVNYVTLSVGQSLHATNFHQLTNANHR
jgi:hypothetical protein